MTILKWLIAGALIYVGIGAFMYVAQRKLLYFPDTARIAPSSLGLQADEVLLDTADGEKLVAWHVAPREGRSFVIYFQGNGGGLNLRAHRFVALANDGFGVLAINYRGYGGSTGTPSEAGLLRDADADYAFAVERYGKDRIIVWGESLGTGVAVGLTSERPVARVILESPFTSIVDVAASIYWFLPVRLLLKDTFHSDARIGRVSAPVLVIHGERDSTISIAFAERLYAMIKGPKSFLRLPEADHNDHDSNGDAIGKVRKFLLEQTK